MLYFVMIFRNSKDRPLKTINMKSVLKALTLSVFFLSTRFFDRFMLKIGRSGEESIVMERLQDLKLR